MATQQTVWVEGQQARISAEARNMSRGGMFVVTEDSLPQAGTTVAVTFDDPREGRVQVSMEVVWRCEQGVSSQLGLRVADPAGMDAFSRVVERYLTSEERKSAPEQ